MTTEFLDEAAEQVTAEHTAHHRTLAVAAVEPFWPYLSAATTPGEFEHRMGTAIQSMRRAVREVVPAEEPDAFRAVRTALYERWQAEHEARTKAERSAALTEAVSRSVSEGLKATAAFEKGDKVERRSDGRKGTVTDTDEGMASASGKVLVKWDDVQQGDGPSSKDWCSTDLGSDSSVKHVLGSKTAGVERVVFKAPSHDYEFAGDGPDSAEISGLVGKYVRLVLFNDFGVAADYARGRFVGQPHYDRNGGGAPGRMGGDVVEWLEDGREDSYPISVDDIHTIVRLEEPAEVGQPRLFASFKDRLPEPTFADRLSAATGSGNYDTGPGYKERHVPGPSGFWCRGCGDYQSTRTPEEVKKAKAHTQAHIDAGHPTRDGGPWIKGGSVTAADSIETPSDTPSFNQHMYEWGYSHGKSNRDGDTPFKEDWKNADGSSIDWRNSDKAFPTGYRDGLEGRPMKFEGSLHTAGYAIVSPKGDHLWGMVYDTEEGARAHHDAVKDRTDDLVPRGLKDWKVQKVDKAPNRTYDKSSPRNPFQPHHGAADDGWEEGLERIRNSDDHRSLLRMIDQNARMRQRLPEDHPSRSHLDRQDEEASKRLRHLQGAKTAGWLDSARAVVENKGFRTVDESGATIPTQWRGDEIDPKSEGMVLDMTTASMLVQIHDALNPENAARFAAMPLERAVTMGWSLAKGRGASLQKGAPFAGYDDFAACVAANSDKDSPSSYCGYIKHKVEDSKESRLADAPEVAGGNSPVRTAQSRGEGSSHRSGERSGEGGSGSARGVRQAHLLATEDGRDRDTRGSLRGVRDNGSVGLVGEPRLGSRGEWGWTEGSGSVPGSGFGGDRGIRPEVHEPSEALGVREGSAVAALLGGVHLSARDRAAADREVAAKTAAGAIRWTSDTHMGAGYLVGLGADGNVYEAYFNPNSNPTPCSWAKYGPEGDTGPNSQIASGRGFATMDEAVADAEAHAATSKTSAGRPCPYCGMSGYNHKASCPTISEASMHTAAKSDQCPKCGSHMDDVTVTGNTLKATCGNCGWSGTKRKASAVEALLAEGLVTDQPRPSNATYPHGAPYSCEVCGQYRDDRACETCAFNAAQQGQRSSGGPLDWVLHGLLPWGSTASVEALLAEATEEEWLEAEGAFFKHPTPPVPSAPRSQQQPSSGGQSRQQPDYHQQLQDMNAREDADRQGQQRSHERHEQYWDAHPEEAERHMQQQAVNESAQGTERYQSQPTQTGTHWDDAWDVPQHVSEDGRAAHQPTNPFAETLTNTRQVRQSALRMLGEDNLQGLEEGHDFEEGGEQPLTTRPRVMPTDHREPSMSNPPTATPEAPATLQSTPGEPVDQFGSFDAAPAMMTGMDPMVPTVDQMVAAKVARVAARVRLDNPTMSAEEAKHLAIRTVARFPEMVKR